VLGVGEGIGESTGVTTEEIKAALHANEGKRARVSFRDRVTQSVDIAAVDQEGVLHSGPDGVEPARYWTRFESIDDVEPESDKT